MALPAVAYVRDAKAASRYDGVGGHGVPAEFNDNNWMVFDLSTLPTGYRLECLRTWNRTYGGCSERFLNGFVDLVGDGLKKTLDFCAEAGLETVTTPHALCKTADEYRKFGQDMSRAAEAAVPYGIKVGIHTTYDHFNVKFDGVTAWDTLMAGTSPLLQQQIDTSNTFHTGTDVVALLKKYRNRHYSVHLKENVPSKTATLGERPTDGGPLVPWKDVMDYLATEPVAWYVIEAEAIPDSLQPLSDSLRFIKAV